MAEGTKSSQYFIAKCDHIKRLYTAKDACIWACAARLQPPQPRTILTEALTQGNVILIFSANNCHGWHGVASMVTAPGCLDTKNTQHSDITGTDPSNPQLTLQSEKHEKGSDTCNSDPPGTHWHKFKIKWHVLFLQEHGEQCLPFSQTEHLVLPDKTSLNKARNLHQLPAETGQVLCQLIQEHYEKLSDLKKRKAEEKLEKLGAPFLNPGKTNPAEVWEELVGRVQTMGKVLLACAFGSQRYNLDTPTSDVDMFVVYAAHTKDLLGFDPPHHTIKSRDTETADYTIHEVHRYCELLLGGDPRCVETLFLHQSSVYYQADSWTHIQSLRDHFLTRQCVDKYLRDATGAKGIRLLDKWVTSGEALVSPMSPKVAKLFYIIIRLIQNASQTACGELQVYRSENSHQRELLISVRKGEMDYSSLRTIVDSLLSEVDEAKAKMTADVCKQTVKQQLEQWMFRLRYSSFQHYMDKQDRPV